MDVAEEAALAIAVRALDAMIIDPARKHELEALRAHTPAWMVDQVRAAIAENTRLITSGVALGKLTHTSLRKPSEHPEHVRFGALEAILVWTGDQGQTCVHSPSPRAPQPVFAAEWRPRLMVCVKCVPMLGNPMRSVQDRTCGACRRIVAGPGTDDPMWLGGVQVGAMTYAFKACSNCRYWEHDADSV